MTKAQGMTIIRDSMISVRGLEVSRCWVGNSAGQEIANEEFRFANGKIGRWMKVVEGGCSWMKVENFFARGKWRDMQRSAFHIAVGGEVV
jgi:hypothetical protein